MILVALTPDLALSTHRRRSECSFSSSGAGYEFYALFLALKNLDTRGLSLDCFLSAPLPEWAGD